ncbi:MAG: phosphatidylethanolamine N-methyltransferase family protein [Acidobacteriia bacterium]|nr:phosphatidylethanolamine N-methyltransferase family protein [Terriglobia bacterium]
MRAEEDSHQDVPAVADRRLRSSPWGRGVFRSVTRIVSTVFAMAGWRLEHLNAVWVAGSVASVLLAHVLITRADWRLTLPYLLFTLVFYYGGNAVVLGSNLPNLAIARLGEERAFRAYETLAGLMFLNQGLGVGCMAALHFPRLEQVVPAPVVLAAGVALFVVGLVVKLWATITVGVDVYYFRDMFLGRPLAAACEVGPYRFLRNPMYSLGQLQGYGYALLYGSLPGLAAAAAGHVLIYAFYVVAERPFVRSTYIRPRPTQTLESVPQ